jgi:hypothetical protein
LSGVDEGGQDLAALLTFRCGRGEWVLVGDSLCAELGIGTVLRKHRDMRMTYTP